MKIPLLLLCLALTATGCIYEDRDNCYNIIRFSYTGDGSEEIFSRKIHEVDLYVFDEDDRCVVLHTLTPEELASQSATVRLVPGRDYTAVCFGFESARNSAPLGLEHGPISETWMYHHISHPEIPTDQTELDTQDHLYFGRGEFSIPAEGNYIHTISLESSHYDVWVGISGLPESVDTRAEGIPTRIEHDNLPVWVDFDNRHSKHHDHSDDKRISHVQYPNNVRVEEGILVREYCVLRHVPTTDDDQNIVLYDSADNEVYRVSVAAFLEEYAELIDPSLNEAVLPILIEFKGVGVYDVSIAEWAIVDTKPEF